MYEISVITNPNGTKIVNCLDDSNGNIVQWAKGQLAIRYDGFSKAFGLSSSGSTANSVSFRRAECAIPFAATDALLLVALQDLIFYNDSVITPGGGGDASAANQLLEIEQLEYISDNTEFIKNNTLKRGTIVPNVHVVSTTAVMVLAANADRQYLTVLNRSGSIIDISTNNLVSPTNSAWTQIPNGAEREFDVFVPTNEIWVRARSGSGNVYVSQS